MENITWSVKNGDFDQVKALVNKENVEAKYANGRTVLLLAADYGHADIVQYLLDIGADIEATDDFGIKPLLAAAWEGHVEVVRKLLAKGAQKDLVAPDGTSLIDCTEDEEIRKLLKA